MTSCETHQMQLSALLDGELERGELLETLDHVVSCPACARFYHDARGLQELVDGWDPLIRPTSEAAADGDRVVRPARLWSRLWSRCSPVGWVAAAAAAVVALIIGVGVQWDDADMRPEASVDAPATIEVADTGAQPMSEDRFVELTVELLRADQRYQQEMADVLRKVERTRPEAWGRAL